MDSEFYVGYNDRAPAGIAQFLRRRVPIVVALVLISGGVIAFTQNRFAPAVFEFGEPREFEGVLVEKPYPQLKVRRPGNTGDLAYLSSFYLVDPLKFGAAQYVRGMDGKRVRLRGELLYRDNQTMLVLDPNSIEVISESAVVVARDSNGSSESPANDETFAAVIPTGRRTLTGEIMDSKCYLGAMNPGERKVHRACAIRCISGGIPPLFVVRDAAGGRHHLLLVSSTGQAINAAVLEYVALPLKITGDVRLEGGVYMLYADPANFERL